MTQNRGEEAACESREAWGLSVGEWAAGYQGPLALLSPLLLSYPCGRVRTGWALEA